VIKRTLNLLGKLIDEAQRRNFQESKEEKLVLNVVNQISNAQPPKKFEIILSNKSTVFETKKIIAKKLNPEQKVLHKKFSL
jgi:hypothetical protein